MFKSLHRNNVTFRAQLFKGEESLTLWIAESETEFYTVSFTSVVSVDVYPTVENQFIAMLLMRDNEEEFFNVEMGKFNSNADAMNFLVWLKNSMNQMS